MLYGIVIVAYTITVFPGVSVVKNLPDKQET